MKSKNLRMVVGLGVIVVAVVLLVVLKSGNSDDASNTDGGKLQTIVVKNGKPVGGIRQLTYNKGEQVLFKVESDVSEEVHMHGYDIMKDVKAAAPSSLTSRRRSKASSRPSWRTAKNRSSN